MGRKANKTMLQAFEWYLEPDFNHWNHLKDLAKEIKSYDINMVWLPPAYKEFRKLLAYNKDGCLEVTPDAVHATGYGVYDRYDLGEFKQVGETEKTKYGTKEEYLQCIDILRSAPHHVDVLVDIVLNQMFSVPEVEGSEPVKAWKYNKDGDRSKPIGGPYDIQAPTIFRYPIRNGAYNADTWDHNDFNSHSWDGEDFIFLFDKKSFNTEVDEGRDIKGGTNPYHNFDYLMGSNVDFTNPATQKKLLDWVKWYIETSKADGIRIDAVKHMDFRFLPKMMEDIRSYTSDDFFAVGEYWSRDEKYGDLLMKYLDKIDNAISLFDVPLHEAFWKAFTENEEDRSHYDLRTLFTESILATRPENAVTFVDNHDSQKGQMLGPSVNPNFRQHAYASMLYQKGGIPCVFYGDLYGIPHDGIAPVPLLGQMCRVRKSCAHGAQKNYFMPDLDLGPFDISNAGSKEEAAGWTEKLNETINENNRRKHYFGYTRAGIKDYKYSGMAVMVSNGSGGTIRMHVNARLAGKPFVNLLDPDYGEVTLNKDGDGDFFVRDCGVAVWILKDAYEYICR